MGLQRVDGLQWVLGLAWVEKVGGLSMGRWVDTGLTGLAWVERVGGLSVGLGRVDGLSMG